jgi:hypothetical protein
VTVSECRIRYRAATGSVHEADLAGVDFRELTEGCPWRTFRWHRGQAHYSGWYWSSTIGDHVVYESRLELARLLLADFDPEVVGIAAQPFRVEARVRGRDRAHIPDFLLLGGDGSVGVVNVKPAEQLARPKVAMALAWASELFASRGWRHELWSGETPTLLGNVRFLAGFRDPRRIDCDALSAARAQTAAGGIFGEAEDRLAAQWPRWLGRPALLHLLWRCELRTDLAVPLSRESVLERAA